VIAEIAMIVLYAGVCIETKGYGDCGEIPIAFFDTKSDCDAVAPALVTAYFNQHANYRFTGAFACVDKKGKVAS
jgi:hypothetical protein